MPQLDLVTFIDQTLYVYLFFIIQYTIVSTRVLPGIYQILAFKHIFFARSAWEIYKSLNYMYMSMIFFEISESKLSFNKIKFGPHFKKKKLLF